VGIPFATAALATAPASATSWRRISSDASRPALHPNPSHLESEFVVFTTDFPSAAVDVSVIVCFICAQLAHRTKRTNTKQRFMTSFADSSCDCRIL
jgi:hypothetical protein